MERLRQRLASLYTRVEVETEQWQQNHSKLLALLGNVQAILSRLPTLSKPAHYGVLASVEGYVERLQAQQVGALEALLSKSQATVASLEVTVRSLSQCATDARRLVDSQRPQLTLQQRMAYAGCEPSLQSCIDGLQQVAQMYADEFRLVAAAVPRFSYASSPEELLTVAALMADQPNIQHATLHNVLETGRLTSAGERRP